MRGQLIIGEVIDTLSVPFGRSMFRNECDIVSVYWEHNEHLVARLRISTHATLNSAFNAVQECPTVSGKPFVFVQNGVEIPTKEGGLYPIMDIGNTLYVRSLKHKARKEFYVESLSFKPAIAIQWYTRKGDHRLNFHVGDYIKILRKPEGSWWWCEFQGKQGYAPKDYLQEIEESAVEDSSSDEESGYAPSAKKKPENSEQDLTSMIEAVLQTATEHLGKKKNKKPKSAITAPRVGIVRGGGPKRALPSGSNLSAPQSNIHTIDESDQEVKVDASHSVDES